MFRVNTGDCFAAYNPENLSTLQLFYACKSYYRKARAGWVVVGEVLGSKSQKIHFHNNKNCRHRLEILPIQITDCKQDPDDILNNLSKYVIPKFKILSTSGIRGASIGNKLKDNLISNIKK